MIIIAHNIRSVYNVGSIFRVAACFGVEEVVLSGYSPTPEHDKFAKTALSSDKYVSWKKYTQLSSAVKSLKSKHVQIKIFGLENNLPKTLQKKLVMLQDIQVKKGEVFALILGEEVGGIPKSAYKYCDGFVEIPMQGKKESLNVSVACGIAVYALTQ